MKQKSEPLVVKDRKVKKLFKKGERRGTERDFIELLTRAITPKTK